MRCQNFSEFIERHRRHVSYECAQIAIGKNGGIALNLEQQRFLLPVKTSQTLDNIRVC